MNDIIACATMQWWSVHISQWLNTWTWTWIPVPSPRVLRIIPHITPSQPSLHNGFLVKGFGRIPENITAHLNPTFETHLHGTDPTLALGSYMRSILDGWTHHMHPRTWSSCFNQDWRDWFAVSFSVLLIWEFQHLLSSSSSSTYAGLLGGCYTFFEFRISCFCLHFVVCLAGLLSFFDYFLFLYFWLSLYPYIWLSRSDKYQSILATIQQIST